MDTLAVLQSAAKAVAPAESQEVYGHLIVLVRDTFDKADEIDRMLFGEEEPDADATHEDVDEIDMRNSTRAKLKKVFQEIKVWCLPQPHADINGEDKNEVIHIDTAVDHRTNERLGSETIHFFSTTTTVYHLFCSTIGIAL